MSAIMLKFERCAPPVEDVGPQQSLTPDGASSVFPVHQEHEDHAEDGGDERHPLVVILNR